MNDKPSKETIINLKKIESKYNIGWDKVKNLYKKEYKMLSENDLALQPSEREKITCHIVDRILYSFSNKSTPQYLGIHIAENMLSKISNSIKTMEYGNPGYDIICGGGYKIDIKASVITKRNYWQFLIKKNKIADYFLLIAFDNRDDLNPQHLWLIPGKDINDKTGVSISPKSISKGKWKEYEQPLDDVISYCDNQKLNL